MKYYEFLLPFYALIKAKTEKKAKVMYKKHVWEGGGDKWHERSRDYAMVKFAMAHDSKKTEVAIMLTHFLDDNCDVLLTDSQTFE
ncbi:hypothetical protein [Salicibibacter kimchii]|uniref:Uncharacterized protein n=1 Tax=Salicibibacter kimchii TaxID=2099786 RepID=A0A345BUE6_9BACI|nr:hypothetical protein [Salicibibacter kimchii]AXF54577.1 hypothetical protein DT065_00120 [Salicibibacter kimchii]